MPQINLLKQNASSHSFSVGAPKIWARLFFLVLLALVLYYVWLFVDSNVTENKINDTQTKISTENQAASGVDNRQEVYTRQEQLRALSGLISSHLYWSQLLPELARVTLKTAGYNSLTADTSGNLNLDVNVPSLTDLDKYMQVFDLSQFNQNFSDIRIGGFNTVQGKDSTTVNFQVSMQFDPSLIQYHPPKQ